MSGPVQRITGLSFREFADTYWGAAPLVRKAAQLPDARIGEFLSLDAVDELLSRRGLRTPFLRVVRNGSVVPPAQYTRGGGAGAEISDQVADDKILAQFAAGATVVLQGMHRMWPPIQEFANALALELGHPVQVNAYITPPMNTGLDAHYDIHDVFVLQFAGRKHWRIHEPVWKLPLRTQPWDQRKPAVAERAAEPPLIDTVMETGDALYLPRGFVHGAASLGDISGHITIGVHSVTRYTIAEQIFATLADNVEMRRSLAAGVDLADPLTIDGELSATLQAMRAAIDRLDVTAIARGLGTHIAGATRPAPIRPLEQLAAADELRENTRVQLRPGLRARMHSRGDEIVIDVPDKAIGFPGHLAEAISVILAGAAVTAIELPAATVQERMDVLAQLLRDGVVVPA